MILDHGTGRSRVKTSKLIFLTMRRNVGRNRNIYLVRTQDYNTGDLLKIEVAQIQEKLFGYATNFHKSRKCVVFETFPE